MSESNQQDGTLVPVQRGYDLAPYAYDTYSQTGGYDPNSADLKQMAALLWQRKWWIILFALLGTGGGILAARFGTDQFYGTSTSVWIEQQINNSRNTAGPIQAQDVFQGEGWRDVMASYAVLEPVVVAEKLYLRHLDPAELGPDIYTAFSLEGELAPGTYTLAVDSLSGDWTLAVDGGGVVESGRKGEPAGASVGFRWIPPDAAAGARVRFRVLPPRVAASQLRGLLTVVYDRNSTLITARIRWADARGAAAILNRVVDTFVQVATDLKVKKLQEVVEFLEEQTAEAAQQLADAELALETFKVQTITLPSEPQTPIAGLPATQSPVFTDYFQKRLNSQQLAANRTQLQDILDELRTTGRLNAVGLQTIAPALASGALQASVQDYANKQIQRNTLLHRYTDQHPDVVTLDLELRTLRELTIPVLIQDVLGEIELQVESLGRQLETQTAELQRIPIRTIESARLQREFVMAEQLHNQLLTRLTTAQLAAATNALPDLQILERAFPPGRPLENKGPQVIMFASVAGVAIGIGGVLLLDRLDKRIRHPEQVTYGLGLPVLGIVPEMDRQRLSAPNHAAMAIESFRALRTQIAHSSHGSREVTLITSPAPREGKSTVSANLAISYAYAGNRTVLVDGDTRRGRAHKMFGSAISPGLTDYLMERASEEDVLQKTDIPRLTFVAAGRVSGFNHETLGGARMAEFLEGLKEDFDVVLLDAPPLAAGADALVLGERCDKVVIVLRAGATDQDLARTKLEMIGNVSLPIIGAVLNALPQSSPYYDHYVSYYYAEAEVEPIDKSA